MSLTWLVGATPVEASTFDPKKVVKVFTAMKRALKTRSEKAFSKQWDPRGYAKNLVGGSGIPGKGVYRQGSRKGWYLKPLMKTAGFLPGQLAGPVLVTVDIWSYRRKRAVDRVHALLIGAANGFVVLGAGEKRDQVIALGMRYVKKKPLEP